MPIEIQNIPERIREYFGSNRVAALITDINKRSGRYNLEAIPKLLYQLEIKELLIKDFIPALAKEIPTTLERAKAIAREIKEKILEPKRHDLESWGINLNELDVSDAKSLDEIRKEDEEFEKQIEKELGIKPKEEVISLEEIIEAKEETLPLKKIEITGEKKPPTEIKITKEKEMPKPEKKPEEKAAPKPEAEKPPLQPVAEKKPVVVPPGPFILEEKKEIEPFPQPAKKPSPLFKTFSLPFELFKKFTSPAKTPMVKTEIEEPQTILTKLKTLKSKIETPPKRVVHYSEFRTPLSPFEKGEKIIEPETKPEQTKTPILEKTPALEKKPIIEETLKKSEEKSNHLPSKENPAPPAPPAPVILAKPDSSPLKTPKNDKSQVKVEGNIIDLRSSSQ